LNLISSIYEPYSILQNTSENIGKKEAGKDGAKFPPDPLSTRLYFGSGLWKKTGEMIFLFYSAIMEAG